MSTFKNSSFRQFKQDNIKVLKAYPMGTLYEMAAILNKIAPHVVKLEEIALRNAPELKLFTSGNDKLYVTTILIALGGLINNEISSRIALDNKIW